MFRSLKLPTAPSTGAPCATEVDFCTSNPVRRVDFGFAVQTESIPLEALPIPKTHGAPPPRFVPPLIKPLAANSYRFTPPTVSHAKYGVLAAQSRRVMLAPKFTTLHTFVGAVHRKTPEQESRSSESDETNTFGASLPWTVELSAIGVLQPPTTSDETNTFCNPLCWTVELTAVDLLQPPTTDKCGTNDIRQFAGRTEGTDSLDLLQPPRTSSGPADLVLAVQDWQSSYLSPRNTQDVGVRLLTPPTAAIPMALSPPKTRGRVFVRFSPVPLRHAGEKSRKEASRQRAPDDDPFAALFYLLLAQQNWDVRVKGLDALLAAYPEDKRPFGFQFEGIKFLASRARALLADEMGLGKTVQAILAMRARIHAGMVQRVLIACPKSLLPTWYYEISVWAPELSLTVVHGPAKAAAMTRKHHVYITNYETVARLICDERGVQRKDFQPFDLLIVDEIQFLKNASAKKSIAVAGVIADQRWALTGTPLENSFDDYRSVWRIISPAMKMGQLTDRQLLSQTKDNVLRREKTAVLKDLPNKLCRVQLVELEGAQLQRYRELEGAARRDASSKLGMKPNDLRMHVLALLTRLKQQCIYDEESGTSAKLDWIHEMLEEMHPVGVDPKHCEKALIFTQYSNLVCDKWDMALVLKQFRPLRYDGSLSEQDRIHFSNTFQTDERHRVAFVSLKAGGTGLTLTRANQVVFLDQWWNPAVMEQAAGRVHRIGQTRMCLITSLVAKDTVDERILKILARKQKLFETLMQEIREGKRQPDDLTKLENALTVDEMLEALGLSRTA